MAEPHEKTPVELVGELGRELGDLYRKELDLLRAEIDEKIGQLLTAGGMIVASIVLAVTALNVLTFALVAGLQNLGLGAGWSAILVAAALAILALILALIGARNLRMSNLLPKRTLRQVAHDVDATREQFT